MDLFVGIKQLEEHSDIFLFPNPVKNGIVYLSRNISGTVSDLQGRELLILKNENIIDVLSFSPGVYVINTSNQDHLRLIIE
ncbi:MAG: T9SS type A sorting domain-containing protein [Bacteroidetes bacterium]|nr:T9SS type A sorting domain-containing protein [Bacteroidota bacterium]